MTLVLDSIAEQIAALPGVVGHGQFITATQDAPTGDLGWGTDLSTVDVGEGLDITPTLDEVDPFSPEAISQASIRRLTTPRGTLPDDPDYGFDVRGYENKGVTTSDLRDVAGLVRLEITKDDRIDDADVTVTVSGSGVGRRMTIKIVITPADPSVTAFSLTLGLTNGEVLLEAMG